MKAIVFGGSGFLGSHVADALSSEGYEVIIYDRKESLYVKDTQRMIVGDILDDQKIQKAVKGCDYVYNFAGVASIEESSLNAKRTLEVNVLGNTNILDACRLHQVKRFIFASTLYVYSAEGSFYRASKQACELIIEAFAQGYGLNYTILRYSSLYGPRADESNWIYRILKQALEEKKITRHGDGKEIREYIHVWDAARLSVKILSPEFKNQCVIITGQQDLQVENLMIMIKEILNNEIELEFVEGQDDSHYTMTPYKFNPKLAKRIFDSSYVDLGQGLLEMINQLYESQHGKNFKQIKV